MHFMSYTRNDLRPMLPPADAPSESTCSVSCMSCIRALFCLGSREKQKAMSSYHPVKLRQD